MYLKLFAMFVLLQFTGCSVVPSILYRIDVQQGNVVTQEMIDKLKPGMTKSQVRFVMGTPLIVDAFRDNRWDYPYMLQEKGELIERHRLTIYFENERLMHIDSSPYADNELPDAGNRHSQHIEYPENNNNN